MDRLLRSAKCLENGAWCTVINNGLIFLNGCPLGTLIANFKHGVLTPLTNRLIVSLHITSTLWRNASVRNKYRALTSILQDIYNAEQSKTVYCGIFYLLFICKVLY
jgi:hypothetical protein